ncbi:MAG: hypothetical protein ACWA44_02565 [Thiotrichales bacterium]
MEATKEYTFADFWADLKELFRTEYCPRKDKDELPVRGHHRTDSPRNLRQATDKQSGQGTHRSKDNKLYSRRTEQNESGADVYVLDSTDVRTEARNVPELMTEFDQEVYYRYKAIVKPDGKQPYKHFKLDRYAAIKKLAYSKCINGKLMNASQASKLQELIDLKGCGERNCKDYFKAMNEAQLMLLQSTPIEQGEGVSQ